MSIVAIYTSRVLKITFENNSTCTKNLKKYLYFRQTFYLFPIVTLREIWNQKYISSNSAFSRLLPIPAGIRRLWRNYFDLWQELYVQSLSLTLLYLLCLLIERMRREIARKWTDNFTLTEQEDGGTIRWVTTWESKHWLPSLPAKLNVINHSLNIIIGFLSYNQIEKQPDKQQIYSKSINKKVSILILIHS